MTSLIAGDTAPNFSTVAHSGEKFSLSDFKGKNVVLYFYPKDDTPGCTAQACSLNDSYESFLAKGYEVIGISPDSPQSHQKFATKYGLKFKLVADTDNAIANAYGVWGEKNMYGKKYFGIIRTTFIINQGGVIEKIIQKVDTKNHAGQILEV